jgi:hypothetical protein
MARRCIGHAWVGGSLSYALRVCGMHVPGTTHTHTHARTPLLLRHVHIHLEGHVACHAVGQELVLEGLQEVGRDHRPGPRAHQRPHRRHHDAHPVRRGGPLAELVDLVGGTVGYGDLVGGLCHVCHIGAQEACTSWSWVASGPTQTDEHAARTSTSDLLVACRRMVLVCGRHSTRLSTRTLHTASTARQQTHANRRYTHTDAG